MATVSLLCARPVIAVPAREAAEHRSDWLTADMATGHQGEVALGEQELGTILGSGLFVSAARDAVTWSHRNLLEFLAAEQLAALSEAQLTQLLRAPDGGLYPQLQGVAPWLLSLRPELAELVLTARPSLLLEADPAAVDTSLRERGVTAWLTAVEHQADDAWTRHPERLRHPGLAEQLRPWLLDRQKSDTVRCAAARLAGVCLVRGLTDTLITIAHDRAESAALRGDCAGALSSLADEPGVREALRSLAALPADEDPRDEFVGAALAALWPDHLTPEELTAWLRPRRWGYHGRYASFLWKLSEHVPEDGLPQLLDWVAGHGPTDVFPNDHHLFVRAVLAAGLREIGQPNVAAAWGRAIDAWLKACHGQLDQVLGDDTFHAADLPTDDRRLAVQAILDAGLDHNTFLLWHYDAKAAEGEDLEWAIGQLDEAVACGASEEARRQWAALVEQAFGAGGCRRFAPVLDAVARHPVELATLAEWVLPVRLRSRQARTLRARHRKFQAMDAKLERLRGRHKEPEKATEPAIAARVERDLAACERGETRWFIDLVWTLTLRPGDTHLHWPHNSDLRTTPVWQEASPAMRARILTAAESFVDSAESDSLDTYFESRGRQLDYAALAGPVAFRLLAQAAPERYESLTVQTWERWLPALVAFDWRVQSTALDDTVHANVLADAYRRSPMSCTEWLLRFAEIENERGFGHDIQAALAALAGTGFAERFLTWFGSRQPQAGFAEACLPALLGELPVTRVAAELPWLRGPGPVSAEDPLFELTATTLASLLLADLTAAWPCVQPRLASSLEVSTRVAELFSHAISWAAKSRLSHVAVDVLAECFVWLRELYPPAEDPHWEGMHEVTLRHDCARCRSLFLSALVDAGAHETVARLNEQVGDGNELLAHVHAARTHRRERTWQPLTPQQVRHLLASTDHRLVRSDDELLEVVLEALSDYQKAMGGDLPEAQTLWSRPVGDQAEPHDELYLRNRVAKWLRDRLERSLGASVEREVAVGPGKEATDISVAVSVRDRADEFQRYRVHIEVKGCWHAELLTAMETQLADRYLREAGATRGIYLAVWFNRERWHRDDPRRRTSRFGAVGELRSFLDSQAAGLSAVDRELRAFVLDASW